MLPRWIIIGDTDKQVTYPVPWYKLGKKMLFFAGWIKIHKTVMAQWVKHKLEFNLHMLNTPEYWEHVKLEDATAILNGFSDVVGLRK